MRPFERRAAAAYPFFRLAKLDATACCLRQMPGTYVTAEEAKAAAKRSGSGTYALSVIEESGKRHEAERFTV